MEKRYELEFSVGAVRCVLLAIQPDNSAERRIGKYYEHRHPCFELHYVERGETRYSFAGKQVSVPSESLIMIPPKMYHKETSCTPDSAKMCLALEIKEPEVNADTADLDFYNAFSTEHETVVPINNSTLKATLREIKALALSNTESYLKREKIRALCHSLAVSIYESLAERDTPAHELSSDSALSREHVIDTFLALNFMSNSAKDDLAARLHVSPRQLHRIIKKSYGKNYREKLSETRIEIALSFLTSSEKRVSEIAELLGYSSAANFSSFIKRATGKTPSEIRRGIK